MAKRKTAKKAGQQAAPKPEPKRGRGRPYGYVGADLVTFYQEIEVGTSLQAACSIVGWNVTAVYAELKRGKLMQKEQRQGKARTFYEGYRQKRAKAEAHYVHIVAQGAAGAGERLRMPCPECGEEIELPVATKVPRAPDTGDAKFMLKVIDPQRYNPERFQKASDLERPISRLEVTGAFQLLGQAVALEVEDSRVLLRIRDRWQEVYRTLGLDAVPLEKKTLPDQKRLPA